MGTHNVAATLIAGHGVVLEAALTAAVPTFADVQAYIAAGANNDSMPAGFTPAGETDPGALPKWDTSGGDENVRRTWRMDKARVTKAPEVRSFTVNALQFDSETMDKYEGGGVDTVANEHTSPVMPTPVEKSVLVIYLDGTNPVAEYIGRTSISSGGAIEHNVDDWSKIPLKYTVMTPTDSTKPEHRWLGQYFGPAA